MPASSASRASRPLIIKSPKRPAGAHYIDPETWAAATAKVEGSWWPAWADWLRNHSAPPAGLPRMGAPDRGYPALAPAPGSYVLEA